ncbi:MAG: GNAT family N-acetyltransferase [Holophagales bacterium]|nr:GNAT family N-acetyltransferase [Holophagales bacterium]
MTTETHPSPATATRAPEVRGLDTADIGDIVAIDEKITGHYRPDIWDTRCVYYLRRDPDAALVAVDGGQVVGFMLGEVRSGEFGLEEPTGWIEVLGVDPDRRGQAIGRRLAEAMLEHFRQKGARSVRTLVDEEMPGIASFFSSLGFEPATLRPFVKSL